MFFWRAVAIRISRFAQPVLRALNRLRETAPRLNFDTAFVTDQILKEARYYYELSAALEPFRDRKDGERPAASCWAARSKNG